MAKALLSALVIAGCSTTTTFPTVPAAVAPAARSGALPDAKAPPSVYWTLFASCSYPQVQHAALPLKSTTTAKNEYCSTHNGLSYSSGLHVDSSGRLWVLNFGAHSGSPGSVSVFNLPFKTDVPTPEYTFVLSGTSDPDHLTFDRSGNLWVSSHNSDVTKYKGPFTKSGTLSPAITLTNGISRPSGIAVDPSGNVYVADFTSTGTNSIAVFKTPISNKPAYYLKGLTQPGGLAFDKSGNLYASENGPSTYAIVRYNSGDLKRGDVPSIADATGLSSTYESDFAFGPSGDLYFANCGDTGSVYEYPTSKEQFSSSLAPSLDYTNADLQQAGCAWGIAIK